MDLEREWTATWRDLALPVPEREVLDDLLTRYAEPHRAYHGRRHLEECFAAFGPVRHLVERPGEVGAAIWFHDVIYDVKASDNERASATWAARVLDAASADHSVCARVRDLILATRHDVLPERGDRRWLCDVDLAILGAEGERFGEYEEQIRAEYSWVAETAYRRARRAIVERFLERPAIYATRYFRGRLESRARANLERALERLYGS